MACRSRVCFLGVSSLSLLFFCSSSIGFSPLESYARSESHSLCYLDHFISTHIICQYLFLEFGMVNLQHHLPVLATLVYGLNVVLVGSLELPVKRAISPDNTCGKNGTGGGADGYTCPSDLPCCSVNGFYGSTNEYCLTTAGCQSAFGNCTAPAVGTVSPDETCGVTGAGTAGYTCSTTSLCCSGK